MITKTIEIKEITVDELADKVAGKLLNKIKHYLDDLYTNESDVYLTRQETADYLRVSLTTIHHWKKHNIIKPIYLGNRVYFKKQHILDVLEQQGWGNGYIDYNSNNGKLFEETLERSKFNDVDAIQVITWNDFGEGTIIEPTIEFGYKRLEQLQVFLGVNYSSNELSLAVKLYKKRKEHKGKDLENKKLDQVFNYLISLKIKEATELLNELQMLEK